MPACFLYFPSSTRGRKVPGRIRRKSALSRPARRTRHVWRPCCVLPTPRFLRPDGGLISPSPFRRWPTFPGMLPTSRLSILFRLPQSPIFHAPHSPGRFLCGREIPGPPCRRPPRPGWFQATPFPRGFPLCRRGRFFSSRRDSIRSRRFFSLLCVQTAGWPMFSSNTAPGIPFLISRPRVFSGDCNLPRTPRPVRGDL